MGQLIEVEQVVLGTVAIFDTDRSLSGQDGETFTDAQEASTSGTFPGLVAQALFNHEPQLTTVYVFSNTISVTRPRAWTDTEASDAASAIRNFLVYYEQNRD